MGRNASFTQVLKQRRKALDMTQQEIARRVGCARVTIQRIEQGTLRPSRQVAQRLATILALPADEHAQFVRVARNGSASDTTATTDDAMMARWSPLPAPLTPLIGRAVEVATACEMLAAPGVRVLTLTGPGGVGKTRLALQVAADVERDFTDGVVFVDLTPIRDPALVPMTLAHALRLPAGDEHTLLARLQAALRERQLLLLLDNFEQLLPAAPLVASLLAAAPQVKVLLTSRVIAGVYGEHDFPVPPLTLPTLSDLPYLDRLGQVETVRLFVERAAAALPDFCLTRDNAHAVSDICHQLDGLPLSIELAAARVRVLPPHLLLQRLGQAVSGRLQVLAGGARTLPARQQTLRATIDWSYTLLTPAERRRFQRLAVFAGGWTVDAADAVTGDAGTAAIAVVDQLQALLANSLILTSEAADGTLRFRMYETLREYALEQLVASGAEPTVRQQHTAYYLQLAETAAVERSTTAPIAWFDRLEQEHDNLRAALAWTEGQPGQAETMLRLAGALSHFWLRSHLSEGFDWTRRALRRTAGPPLEGQHRSSELLRLRADVLPEAAHLAAMRGDMAQARRDVDESLALYEALGETAGPGLANALVAAGRSAEDVATAVALIERSVVLYRALGDDAQVCSVLCVLGKITRFAGRYAQSEAFFTQALDLARATHKGWQLAEVLENMGTLALHQHAPGRALSMLEESVQLLRGPQAGGTVLALAWALVHLAEARRVAGGMRGDAAAIRPLWEEGLALLRPSYARENSAWMLVEIGELVYEQGDDARAAELLCESITVLHQLEFGSPELGRALEAMGAVWAHRAQPGALERAVQLWSAATTWHQHKPRESPIRRARYDRTIAAVRTELGEERYAAAWTAGQDLSLDQAVVAALEAAGT